MRAQRRYLRISRIYAMIIVLRYFSMIGTALKVEPYHQSLRNLHSNSASIQQALDNIQAHSSGNYLRDFSSEDGQLFKQTMDDLKLKKAAPLWNTASLKPTPVSKNELKLLTRNLFESDDFLTDVMRSAMRSSLTTTTTTTTTSTKSNEKMMPMITLSNITVLLFVLGLSVVSFTDNHVMPQVWRNALGSMSLVTPFIVIAVGLLAPTAYDWLELQLQTLLYPKIMKKRLAIQQERILYHEAGHYVAGYLCGIPVVDYDISGKDDAGLSVLIELNTQLQLSTSRNAFPSEKIFYDNSDVNKSDSNKYNNENNGLYKNDQEQERLEQEAGGLLVVAVAGVVAEYLQFGDARGGKQDFPIAYEILRQLFGLKLSFLPNNVAREDTSSKIRGDTNHNKDYLSTQLKDRKRIEEKQDAYLRWALSKAVVLLRLYAPAVEAVVQVMRNSRMNSSISSDTNHYDKNADSKTNSSERDSSNNRRISDCIVAIEEAMLLHQQQNSVQNIQQ